jgi:2-polyprenyl-3-methyl-5-hydroxy-6-metoxy-1,4-benzoquinol methylase
VDKSNISDEEINIDEVTRAIKDKIKRRNAMAEVVSEHMLDPKTRKELEFINTNWDIRNNNYIISSHRGIFGKALVKGRELVLGEIRRYVDPIIGKQREFNSCIVEILNYVVGMIGVISSQTEEKIAQSQSIIISQIEDKIAQSTMVDGLNYVAFEDKFRGSRQEIKEKQTIFIKYFEGCKNVLDIGCGRGEFLELLKEHDIGGCGVDIDEDMVAYCNSLELDAKKIDAISHLSQLKDESLDGVFIDQVVEHLDPSYLTRMINLSNKKMAPGAHIIIQTVNPLSLVSLANFYIDMSHKKPVHPETLKFLVQSAGFGETVLQFYSPVEESRQFRQIDAAGLEEKERKVIEVINQNIKMLNCVIYGPQDYAVIAKK